MLALPPESEGAMPSGTSKLLMAMTHVARGREIVAKQRDLIGRIRKAGGDAVQAEDLLRSFEHSLAIFESDLAEIEKG